MNHLRINKERIVSWAHHLTRRERYALTSAMMIILAVTTYGTSYYLVKKHIYLVSKIAVLKENQHTISNQKIALKENESILEQLEIEIKKNIAQNPVELLIDLVSKNDLKLVSFNKTKDFVKKNKLRAESSLAVNGTLAQLLNFVKNLNEAQKQIVYDRIEIKSHDQLFRATIHYHIIKNQLLETDQTKT